MRFLRFIRPCSGLISVEMIWLLQGIISIESGKIKFSWKDYRDNGLWKKMELEADEFLGRFLLHILPDGYYKIRYFGIFAYS